MKRRDLLKSAFGLTAGMVGMSALKPLYASDDMVVRGPAVPDVAYTKVSDRCYYLLAKDPEPSPENFGFFSNPGFIVTSEGVVVIDTGGSVQIAEMLLRQIKKVTDKPVVAVINTHYHGDHWLGNHAFVAANPNVDIYSHQVVINQIKNGSGDFWIGFMQRTTGNKVSGTIATSPTKALAGGETLKFGDTTLKIHHFGKVHTESDLAIEVVEDKVLYSGDMMMRRIANMADGSYVGSIEAMDKIKALPVDTYIPGHGKHDGENLPNEFKTFCETIYNDAAKYYDEGLSDFEMKPKIMAHPFMKDVASQWPGYDSTLGKFIVVAIAEVEKSMF
ncbi:MBL fold metallo-hydrolase [Thiomicrorhabdus sp.]|uniref:MBL fold metallo-hydrolase n=1 Tax=Thiomicrorhabdus sp. TaxID=2039724 RepID=UPI003566941E